LCGAGAARAFAQEAAGLAEGAFGQDEFTVAHEDPGGEQKHLVMGHQPVGEFAHFAGDKGGDEVPPGQSGLLRTAWSAGAGAGAAVTAPGLDFVGGGRLHGGASAAREVPG
jgi:hypothetical protein